MPVDRAKMKRLTDEKFRQGRRQRGGPTTRDMNAALEATSAEMGVPTYSYDNHADFEFGHRDRIYLDQLEVVARVLGVGVCELLDGETATRDWEAGRQAGVRVAVARVHSVLNELAEE